MSSCASMGVAVALQGRDLGVSWSRLSFDLYLRCLGRILLLLKSGTTTWLYSITILHNARLCDVAQQHAEDSITRTTHKLFAMNDTNKPLLDLCHRIAGWLMGLQSSKRQAWFWMAATSWTSASHLYVSSPFYLLDLILTHDVPYIQQQEQEIYPRCSMRVCTFQGYTCWARQSRSRELHGMVNL